MHLVNDTNAEVTECESHHVIFSLGFVCVVLIHCIKDGHEDIFGHAHRCGYPKHPTYVGYSAIMPQHFSDRQPIRIRMAIPKLCIVHEQVTNNKHGNRWCIPWWWKNETKESFCLLPFWVFPSDQPESPLVRHIVDGVPRGPRVGTSHPRQRVSLLMIKINTVSMIKLDGDPICNFTPFKMRWVKPLVVLRWHCCSQRRSCPPRPGCGTGSRSPGTN